MGAKNPPWSGWGSGVLGATVGPRSGEKAARENERRAVGEPCKKRLRAAKGKPHCSSPALKGCSSAGLSDGSRARGNGFELEDGRLRSDLGSRRFFTQKAVRQCCPELEVPHPGDGQAEGKVCNRAACKVPSNLIHAAASSRRPARTRGHSKDSQAAKPQCWGRTFLLGLWLCNLFLLSPLEVAWPTPNCSPVKKTNPILRISSSPSPACSSPAFDLK